MISEFSSIHAHSDFSLLDGLSKPDEMVRAAKERGLRSIAITDHGVTHGHANFFLAGKKHGMRTILGSESYMIDSLDEWRKLKESYADKRSGDDEDYDSDADVRASDDTTRRLLRRKGHIVLLASDRTGLSNLYRLTYLAHKHGFYGKPRIDKAMLLEHSRGLVATSACMGGVIALKIWDFLDGACDWGAVVNEAKEVEEIFGKGRFFLELQFNELEQQPTINMALVKLSSETGIPLVVGADSHYVNEDDWKSQEALYMIRSKLSMATRGTSWNFATRQLYIKTPSQMWESYERYGRNVDADVALGAFENTLLVDSLITDFEPDMRQRLPTIRGCDDPLRELGNRTIAELKRRGLDSDKKYADRLLHELSIIREKGLSQYFIIMADIISDARKEMYVGSGRGSSAGALTCYMLGITDIDPIKHNLMFERFLDPSRQEMPDIDTDFQDVDRVKQMLRDKYGEDNVACLSVYGTYQIKGLLKDLGRVYDLDHNDVNAVNRKIERELRVLHVAGTDKSSIVITLDDLERVSPTFNSFVEQNPEIGKHLRTLYGKNRHVGGHASGVVIGDDLPTETSVFFKDGVAQVSFTEGVVNKDLSTMGFVKFDILGIATLRIIDHAVRLVAKKLGKSYEDVRESLRPHNIDLDDQVVMRHVFHDGNFGGVFQFTNKGIRRVAQMIRPDCFNDISAICSMYRPGPLYAKMHELYANNKQKALAGELLYDHPVLAEILNETHGTMLYQEQIMLICHKLAGISMADTNKIRKLFLKKTKSADATRDADTKKYGDMFVDGVMRSGMTREYAEKLWDNIKAFAGYGFNVSHSKSYSVMTMQCAHLATYHPLEFYSAVLTKGQAGEMQDYVSDIQRAGVKVLPVDVNKSVLEHRIEGDAIRLSLLTVDGVGEAAASKIIAGQPYSSFIDFLDRSGASKTAVMPLIFVGAFDSITSGMKMRELEEKYTTYTSRPKLRTLKHRDEWIKIWSEPYANGDYTPYDKIMLESSVLGFIVKGSPFEVLDRDRKIDELFSDMPCDLSTFVGGEENVVMLPVLVRDIKARPQRGGKTMAFIKFLTRSGEEFDAPCFATVWQHNGARIKKGNVYIVTFNRKPDDPESLIVGKPGFSHSALSSIGYFLDLDEINV